MKDYSKNKRIRIADIGTGSGAIAIALKKSFPKATVFATDISRRALLVAKKNAKFHGVKIHFYEGDLFSPFKNKTFDVIVANLPYLPKNVSRKKSLRFEPSLALEDKNYLKRFLEQAPYHLQTKGKIYLETSKRFRKQIENSPLSCFAIFF